jgi:hypothetical protein
MPGWCCKSQATSFWPDRQAGGGMMATKAIYAPGGKAAALDNAYVASSLSTCTM